MKKLLIVLVTLVVLVTSAFVIAREIRSSRANSVQSVADASPPGYTSLSFGMSPAQVTALMGKPQSRSANTKFEVKTPQQWAAIKSELEAAGPFSSDPSAAPNLAILKLGAMYEHRIKETWRYEPKAPAFAEVAFDGTDQVCDYTHGYDASAPAKK